MKKYRVQFSFHTMAEIEVEAENEYDAIAKANGTDIPDSELLHNLQEDGAPFAEEI